VNEIINEKVSTVSSYNQSNGVVMPRKIKWQGRIYIINRLNYHHKIRQGRTMLHIFHVTDGNIDFRLCFNTNNLHWTLEEVCDGISS